MEKRLHLYVKRNHAATWLMAVCMGASSVATVVMSRGKVFTSTGIWCGIVLPCVCVIWYALVVLLSGKERFYKTAIPVWVLGISCVVQLKQVMQGCALLWHLVTKQPGHGFLQWEQEIIIFPKTHQSVIGFLSQIQFQSS